MNRKSEILAELARSRSAIARDSAAVQAQFDLSARIQRSVKARPFAWLGGAAAIGYMLAGPKTRTKTVTKFVRDKSGSRSQKPAAPKEKSAGFFGLLLSLLKLAIPLVRPALSAYAAKRFGDFAQRLNK